MRLGERLSLHRIDGHAAQADRLRAGAAWAGTTLYCLSKAVGLAIGRAFADNYPIAVITHLYHNIGLPATPVTGAEGVREPPILTLNNATVPNAVSWLLVCRRRGCLRSQ